MSSTGKYFSVEFDAAETATLFRATLNRAVGPVMTGRWQRVPTEGTPGPVFMMSGHCVAELASPSSIIQSTDHDCDVDDTAIPTVIVFGGAASHIDVVTHSNITHRLILDGVHEVTPAVVQPFEEKGVFLLPPSREGHGSAVVLGKMFIHGGTNGRAVFSDLWSLDLTDGKWSRLQYPVLPPLSAHRMVAHGATLLIIGGAASGGNASNTVYRVDPVTLQAATIAPLNDARMNHGAATNAAGAVLVLGGINRQRSDEAVRSVELLRQGTVAWSRELVTPTLPPMTAPIVAASCNEWYVLGGDGRAGLPQLYRLTSGLEGIVAQGIVCLGASPLQVRGVACQVTLQHLYLIGDVGDTEGTGLLRVRLPEENSKIECENLR